MTFWLTAAAMAGAIAALLALAVFRGRRDARLAAAHDVEVYRDQLAEIDRDRARGVLSDEEAERTRLEVSRRLLDADRKAQGAPPPGQAPRAATLAVSAAMVLLVVGGSFLLYSRIGAPGYGDMPRAARIEAAEVARANRPGQAAAEADAAAPPRPEVNADFVELMERLRTTVGARPDDVRGHVLLARNEARLGNYKAAYTAQRRVIDLKGEAATASDWADYADLLILAAGGYVSPQAEGALSEVLRRDAANGRARYYMGLLYAQIGRPDLAFRLWRPLLEESPPDAPWLPPIRAQIDELARAAGVDYRPPAPQAGPSQADLDAAAGMSPEQRQTMVRGMVGRLSDRLASAGGPPRDWARLISALGVLGETEQARDIYAEARQAFADAPDALATIARAAERAGLAE